MTPADTFPLRHLPLSHGCRSTTPSPTTRAVSSGVGNYGPMTTTHHRIKTHGRWQVQQPFPGIYLWRDPHGATYLVDHTGTRRLPRLAGASRPEVGFSRLLLTLAA